MSYSNTILIIGIFLLVICVIMFVSGLFIGAEWENSDVDQKYGDDLRKSWNTIILSIFSLSIIIIISGILVGRYIEKKY